MAHEDPSFDLTPRSDCKPEIANCSRANPCGKADHLWHLWNKHTKTQLKGDDVHMQISLCSLSGSVDDLEVGVAKFVTEGAPNVIDKHWHWDRFHETSWEPFQFSTCCSTITIAPLIG